MWNFSLWTADTSPLSTASEKSQPKNNSKSKSSQPTQSSAISPSYSANRFCPKSCGWEKTCIKKQQNSRHPASSDLSVSKQSLLTTSKSSPSKSQRESLQAQT